MLSKVRKSLKYFIILIGIIILLPTVLYVLLQVPAVQTFLIKRITNHLSNEVKSTITLGSIEYKFFNKLEITKLLIKDKNNDTLLYTDAVTAGVRSIDLRNKILRLGKIDVINPVIALITDSTGQMNLTWYLNMLKNPIDTVKKGSTSILIHQIDLDNARFSMVNRNGISGRNKIQFNNLNLSGINGIIEDLRIMDDTTSFALYNLAFKEASGFTVNKMTGNITLAKQNILLTSVFLSCGNSILNIPRFALHADSPESFKKFTEEVKLEVLLEKSQISSRDLSYFVHLPDSLDESCWISGKIMGTVSELRGRNILLSYRDHTLLDCDFDFSGLPKIENTYLYIGVNSLKTNPGDLASIKIPGKKSLVIPDALKKLGNITFDGSFTGFTTDFVTYGEIRTSLGNLRTDISLRPDKTGRYKVKGLLTGSDIKLGQLAGKPDFLGDVSIHSNVDGYAYTLKKFEGDLTGNVDSIEINRYVYRNIGLKGTFTEKTWDGSININDKNIKFNLLGLLNFKNDLPEFDFTLNIADANLYKLNFDKLDTTATVTMLLTSNFKGNNIDNLDGEIKLLNSNFKKFNKNLELYDFSIRTYKEDDKPVLSLRTDFVDADIKGYYNFSALGSLIKSTLNNLMPSQFHNTGTQSDISKNNFTFEVNFKNTDKINNFLRTGILVSENSYIRGTIRADSVIRIGGKADQLSIKNNILNDFAFDARVEGKALNVDIKSTSLNLLGESELKDFRVDLNTKPDNFLFNVNWDNKEQVLNQGRLLARGTVAKNAAGNQNTVLKIDIDSSRIYSDNNLWKVSKSTVFIDSNSVKINKLAAASVDKSYMIDGAVSENSSDTLHLNFKGINIYPVNYWLNRKRSNDPTAISLDFQGTLDGKILLSNIYHNLLLEGNLKIEKFAMLGTDFGDISIESILNNSRKVINLRASNYLNSLKSLEAEGTYDPASKKIDVIAKTDKFPVVFLNPLLKVFASEITGTASGKLNLSGKTDNLVLQGAVLAENTSMKINYLQTKYSISDSIRFDRRGIRFNSIKISDIKGNAAILSGIVTHKNFKEYAADLIISINNTSFQVLNTQPQDNPMFYGTIYASGVAKIKSDQNGLAFDVSAKTGKNSKLSVPLSKGLSVSEYSYISFVDPKKGNTLAKTDKVHPATAAKQTGMDLNINLEVTPDAEVEIIFDSKVGDIMKGQGSSPNLNLNLNKKGDFKILGDYTIENGEYTFTLGNILNKPFSVENGGKIMFNGFLKDTEIDLKASYLGLRASLTPILGEEYSERVRVEPQLSLTGKMFNPIVSFDIELPDADEQTKTYLRNSISTEEELTRQVFSLLLMNSFISTGSATASGSSSGSSAISATTYEMLGNQISNWLSQISKDLDIGLNIRPGSNTISPQEAQLALSTQILNDKVVLNGNVDVRGAGTGASNTNQLTGDFDAELKLTERLRFKVFSRYNDIYQGTGLSPYTQGVGIFYKQDFNRFSDLFRKKKKSDMKKREETKLTDK